ncbi:hypothetical protein CYMTET_15476 [Cymbomonas tetramitiformis]|uniref:Uncharacterized protein n=1 Tax=Cymbomonas tetramitiformis TaxID=36881 RepID=A0AAE0GED4_9CHLO|nr:hypothetical protein CYMTET_15476 [Cymbomonas tetramitiformis]
MRVKEQAKRKSLQRCGQHGKRTVLDKAEEVVPDRVVDASTLAMETTPSTQQCLANINEPSSPKTPLYVDTDSSSPSTAHSTEQSGGSPDAAPVTTPGFSLPLAPPHGVEPEPTAILRNSRADPLSASLRPVAAGCTSDESLGEAFCADTSVTVPESSEKRSTVQNVKEPPSLSCEQGATHKMYQMKTPKFAWKAKHSREQSDALGTNEPDRDSKSSWSASDCKAQSALTATTATSPSTLTSSAAKSTRVRVRRPSFDEPEKLEESLRLSSDRHSDEHMPPPPKKLRGKLPKAMSFEHSTSSTLSGSQDEAPSLSENLPDPPALLLSRESLETSVVRSAANLPSEAVPASHVARMTRRRSSRGQPRDTHSTAGARIKIIAPIPNVTSSPSKAAAPQSSTAKTAPPSVPSPKAVPQHAPSVTPEEVSLSSPHMETPAAAAAKAEDNETDEELAMRLHREMNGTPLRTTRSRLPAATKNNDSIDEVHEMDPGLLPSI